jgi:large subunit ribosomal protein L31e
MAEIKKDENVEREYVIPLRDKWKRVPRYKRANKAVKAIKEFLVRHMKIRDRDLKKVKIDEYLNQEIWFKGIKNPPSKVKVKVIKENGVVKVELHTLPKKLKFKKAREEKREIKAVEEKKAKETPTMKEKLEEAKNAEVPEEEKEEKKVEAKEKKSAVVEAGERMEKAAAKKVKHETKGDAKQPKHQQRKALAK